MSSIVKNDLFDYPNRYIMQMDDGFKLSIDAILLAEYVKLKKDAKILDMCTGNAPIPLILSLKTNDLIVGFEIQKDIADLAQKSVDINKIDNIKIINADVKTIGDFYKPKFFDIITCNPPYFKTNDNGFKNKNDYKTISRHEVFITLEDIFNIVSIYLKNNGTFYLIHRIERLDEIINLAFKYKLNVKEVQIITTKKDIPKMIILKIVKNGKLGIKFRKIICVDNLSTYQHLFVGEE